LRCRAGEKHFYSLNPRVYSFAQTEIWYLQKNLVCLYTLSYFSSTFSLLLLFKQLNSETIFKTFHMEQLFMFLNLKKWKKRAEASFLFLSFSIILLGQKYGISVPFSLDNFRLAKTDSFTLIQCIENKDIKYPIQTGDPLLPYIPFYVLMPQNSSITSIYIEKSNFQAIEGNYRIALKNKEKYTSDSGFSNRDSAIINSPDNSSNYFPPEGQSMLKDSSQLYAGYLINRIFLCPFRYIEKNHQLLFSTRIVIEIAYTTEDKPLKFETSPEKIRQSKEFIKDMVINPWEANNILPLEEKIDYSRIPRFKETEDKSRESKKTNTNEYKKEKSAEPFYIKQIKIE
jgi:hypothetical protein